MGTSLILLSVMRFLIYKDMSYPFKQGIFKSVNISFIGLDSLSDYVKFSYLNTLIPSCPLVAVTI